MGKPDIWYPSEFDDSTAQDDLTAISCPDDLEMEVVPDKQVSFRPQSPRSPLSPCYPFENFSPWLCGSGREFLCRARAAVLCAPSIQNWMENARMNRRCRLDFRENLATGKTPLHFLGFYLPLFVPFFIGTYIMEAIGHDIGMDGGVVWMVVSFFCLLGLILLDHRSKVGPKEAFTRIWYGAVNNVHLWVRIVTILLEYFSIFGLAGLVFEIEANACDEVKPVLSCRRFDYVGLGGEPYQTNLDIKSAYMQEVISVEYMWIGVLGVCAIVEIWNLLTLHWTHTSRSLDFIFRWRYKGSEVDTCPRRKSAKKRLKTRDIIYQTLDACLKNMCLPFLMATLLPFSLYREFVVQVPSKWVYWMELLGVHLLMVFKMEQPSSLSRETFVKVLRRCVVGLHEKDTEKRERRAGCGLLDRPTIVSEKAEDDDFAVEKKTPHAPLGDPEGASVVKMPTMPCPYCHRALKRCDGSHLSALGMRCDCRNHTNRYEALVAYREACDGKPLCVYACTNFECAWPRVRHEYFIERASEESIWQRTPYFECIYCHEDRQVMKTKFECPGDFVFSHPEMQMLAAIPAIKMLRGIKNKNSRFVNVLAIRDELFGFDTVYELPLFITVSVMAFSCGFALVLKRLLSLPYATQSGSHKTLEQFGEACLSIQFTMFGFAFLLAYTMGAPLTFYGILANIRTSSGNLRALVMFAVLATLFYVCGSGYVVGRTVLHECCATCLQQGCCSAVNTTEFPNGEQSCPDRYECPL